MFDWEWCIANNVSNFHVLERGENISFGAYTPCSLFINLWNAVLVLTQQNKERTKMTPSLPLRSPLGFRQHEDLAHAILENSIDLKKKPKPCGIAEFYRLHFGYYVLSACLSRFKYMLDMIVVNAHLQAFKLQVSTQAQPSDPANNSTT